MYFVEDIHHHHHNHHQKTSHICIFNQPSKHREMKLIAYETEIIF
jgi:hypothetical protein